MKIVAVGDTHGRKAWKYVNMIEEGEYDKFVFIGDYFDSFSIPFEDQYNNFARILQFKQKNPDKVVLLIGNHDFHYLRAAGNDQYSGYQGKYVGKLREIIQSAIDAGLMQMAFDADGFLYTHAGVTKTWLKEQIDGEITPDMVTEVINKMFLQNPRAFRFYADDHSHCGEDVHQSCIWVRPDSLASDAIALYKQVVGHTTFDEPMVLKNTHFIDCLGKSGQYLFVNDGKPLNKTINFNENFKHN